MGGIFLAEYLLLSSRCDHALVVVSNMAARLAGCVITGIVDYCVAWPALRKHLSLNTASRSFHAIFIQLKCDENDYWINVKQLRGTFVRLNLFSPRMWQKRFLNHFQATFLSEKTAIQRALSFTQTIRPYNIDMPRILASVFLVMRSSRKLSAPSTVIPSR